MGFAFNLPHKPIKCVELLFVNIAKYLKIWIRSWWLTCNLRLPFVFSFSFTLFCSTTSPDWIAILKLKEKDWEQTYQNPCCRLERVTEFFIWPIKDKLNNLIDMYIGRYKRIMFAHLFSWGHCFLNVLFVTRASIRKPESKNVCPSSRDTGVPPSRERCVVMRIATLTW